MTAPAFGYQSSRPLDDEVSVLGADFSKFGLVSTSDDADPAVFPPDVPVRFTSTDPAYLSKLGTGYLADAVRGINAQLNGKGGDIVIVRVPEGTGATAAARLAATHARIIGSAGSKTGLYALRAAPSEVKATPRLIGVPGYTAQQPDGLLVSNPVVAALPEHLAALRAMCVVDVAAGTKEAAIAARETMSSQRMIPLGVAARVYETINNESTLVTRPMSPRVLGLFARVDNEENQGKPFETIANRPIYGLADINRPISFALDDGATEGQLMLAQDISVVVRGESAVDAAIADGGFFFIGTESAERSDLWSQFHQVRGADYIDLKAMRITREFLGPRITPQRAEAWLNSLGFMLKDHVAATDLLGYRLTFPKALNSVPEVRQGRLKIVTEIEPAPSFRVATNILRRYAPAVDALVDAIIARAGTSSAVVS
jgi:phage tail sheath protein FI